MGLDAAIIMNPQTWVTTGHVAGFSDPLLDCKSCKARHRADKLIGDAHPDVNVDAMSFDEMDAFIAQHDDCLLYTSRNKPFRRTAPAYGNCKSNYETARNLCV